MREAGDQEGREAAKPLALNREKRPKMGKTGSV
jgi:hypothetical protein